MFGIGRRYKEPICSSYTRIRDFTISTALRSVGRWFCSKVQLTEFRAILVSEFWNNWIFHQDLFTELKVGRWSGAECGLKSPKFSDFVLKLNRVYGSLVIAFLLAAFYNNRPMHRRTHQETHTVDTVTRLIFSVSGWYCGNVGRCGLAGSTAFSR